MPWLWSRKSSQNSRGPRKDVEDVDLSTYGRQSPQMKFAVFQVSAPGKRAALVCLEMRSLQAAAELEHWLRMNVNGKTLVKLLGRFDSVYFPSSETGTESVVFGGRELFQSANLDLVAETILASPSTTTRPLPTVYAIAIGA